MGPLMKFSNLVGSHMSIVAPTCVILGVAFPELFGQIKPLVPPFFALMTFQGALNNDLKSVVDVFRHPRNMLAILLVTAVIMPVVANLLAMMLFGGSPNLVTGITLEYCVPVAVVSFMWTDIYDGNRALSLATILTSTVLAPFTIPLTLQVLLGETVEVDALGMMSDMLFMIALPALAGMLVNEWTHGWGRRELSPRVSPFAKIAMMCNMAANSTGMSEYVRHLTPELFGVMAFILAFATCGFLLGTTLARVLRVSAATHVSMAFAVGLRNISAGAVLAAQYFPGEVVFPVMMGTLFQQVLAGFFATRFKAIVERERASAQEALGRGGE